VRARLNEKPGLLSVAVLALAIFVAPGCSRSSRSPNDVSFVLASDPQPPRAGRNTFTVTLTSQTGQPVAGAQVSLEGDMSHPGMSPAFADAKEIAAGKYQARLDLSMLGDWTVTAHIQLPSGRTFDRETKFPNLQPN
jgi:YtkA-like protein